MSFQTPVTVHAALEAIRDQEYVLPAIQREFVWKTPKICALFDSLMRGYPIGSFLFWSVKAESAGDYTFYEFLKNYHEADAQYCPRADLRADRPVTAILDGQQRLTSLNVGLRGSFAERKKYGRKDDPDAYPKKFLHLNLAADAPADSEVGLKHDFRFLTLPEAAGRNDAAAGAGDGGGPAAFWFRVPAVYGYKSGRDIHRQLVAAGLADDTAAYDRLDRLWELVHRDKVVAYYEEPAQDLDKVLNIFVRVNSGGEPLSYSDLLLSIATANWGGDTDAKEEVRDLVKQINGVGRGFNFNKDVVLKAGLVLTGREQQSIAFRVTNFTTGRIKALEAAWADIAAAVGTATRLLDAFGFSEQTLKARSVLIPLAYYVRHRGLGPGYVTAPAERADRELVRSWVTRSVFKPSGVWGSGLDTLLLALRSAIRDHGGDGWPAERVESVMAEAGKSLRFSEEEIDVLLDTEYGDARTFALLAFLFQEVNTRDLFHLDHVVPRSRLTRSKLAATGLDAAEADLWFRRRDGLPNLQLLEGAENQSKNAAMPGDWLPRYKPDPAAQERYRDLHKLGDLPTDVADFPAFYDDRRERLKNRLRSLLGGGRGQ